MMNEFAVSMYATSKDARIAQLEAERNRLLAMFRGLKIAENSYDDNELRCLIHRVCDEAIEG